jgi:polyphosphate kinase
LRSKKRNKHEFVIIPLGKVLPRFIRIPSKNNHEYILIEDLVLMFLGKFFPPGTVMEAVPFRVTRNAGVAVQEDLATDFLTEMESLMNKRKESGCVRLEIGGDTTKALLSFMKKAFKINERNLYKEKGPLDLSSFMMLASLDGYNDLKYKQWHPQTSPDIDLKDNIFDELKKKDILLYHPYDSFDTVVAFIEQASQDPGVLAIKQTLYRTSPDSPVIKALMKAAKSGKYVTVIVELKARFDEERNITWAKKLEHAGVQVIYGIKGLKTHCKLCIVVRKEADGVCKYMHFGTGNYHDKTARLYGDISYLTANQELGLDATVFFNAISGYTEPLELNRLIAAPMGLRERILKLIQDETDRSKQGQKAIIKAKMNSLVDPQIIKALYKASNAGVQIQLNIRGICCLKPGVKGLSENISVISIVDRFLEHARIFYFYHGGKEKVYISSADWMPRNLDRRVELMVPVEETQSRKMLISILNIHLEDNIKSSFLCSDGKYKKMQTSKKKSMRSQEFLYQQTCSKNEQSRKMKRMTFQFHHPSARRDH